jgi:phosphoribosylformylglycinamidine (FGAM) synthase-like amidotransferase family enzyme
MMPHPERCCEVEMGGVDGRGILLGAAGVLNPI